MMAGRTSMWPAIQRRAVCTTTTTTALLPIPVSFRARRSTTTASRRRGWVSQRPITITTASSTFSKQIFRTISPNLYHNNGNGIFSDRVFEAGLGRLRSYLGWGALFLDYDNDTWPDILTVN